MNDLQMTKYGDLALSQYDILTTDSIEQAILIRLRWFLAEWVYNESYGLPWWEKILIKNPNRQLIKTLLTKEIMSVDGVLSVTSMTLTIDNGTRVATIGFTVSTTQGTMDLIETANIDKGYCITAYAINMGQTLVIEGPRALVWVDDESELNFAEEANVSVSDDGTVLTIEEVDGLYV